MKRKIALTLDKFFDKPLAEIVAPITVGVMAKIMMIVLFNVYGSIGLLVSIILSVLMIYLFSKLLGWVLDESIKEMDREFSEMLKSIELNYKDNNMKLEEKEYISIEEDE